MTDRRHLTPVPNDGTSGTVTPPHDTPAEQAVLGALLTGHRHALTQVTETITPADHYTPRHELIHAAIEHLWSRGEPIDLITVGDHLHRTHQLDRAGGRTYLAELLTNAPIPETAAYHANIVAEHATRRRVLTLANTLRSTALTPGDLNLEQLTTDTTHQLEHARPSVPGLEHDTTPGQDIATFLDGHDDHYDWLIPGFLERGDRLILTAGEGAGKSTLLRQWATQAAAGIHPVNGRDTTPIKVLILDLENSDRQTRRKIRPLHAKVAHRINPDNLVILCKSDGIDLTNPTDVAWLDRLLATHQPDLLVSGPLYKMAGGNPNDEADAKPAALTLDTLRTRHDVALILEAHSRKGEGGSSKNRPKEPFGWSGWMRWPEFGIHLADDGTITHWRGMRDERTFPHQLDRGGDWPWTPVVTLASASLEKIKDAARDAGRELSVREYERVTGVARSTVQDILSKHRLEVAQAAHGVEQDGQR